MLYPDQSIQGETQRIALDQGTNFDLNNGAHSPHWFNQIAQPGLDTSELKTAVPVCTHAQRRIFAERNYDTMT